MEDDVAATREAAGLRRSEKKATLHDRHVHAYYRPWLDAHGSSLNVANHVESIAANDLRGQGYRPRSSHDKALIAFAQLAVLRLGVKRGMVSLIDSKNQYILAEATNSSFMTRSDDPNDNSYHTPKDVWLGSTILNRSDAVCEHCMSDTATAADTDGRKWSCGGLVLSDLRLDERFKDRSYVKSEPGVRFYAGVPILDRAGYKIGAYAVSDDTPRDRKLSVDELKFMQEMAQAVMDHLEWARDRVDRFKGERIVRGLTAFIEGCSSIDPLPRNKEQARSGSWPTESSSPAPSPGPSPADDTGSRPALVSRSSFEKKTVQHTRSDKMSRMFERATQILRESTLADGAVMFGAASGLVGRSSNMKVMADMGNEQVDGATGLQEIPKSSSPGSESGGHSTASGSDSDVSPSTRPCRILALSLADERAQEDIEQKSALSYGTLEKYRKLFPKGKTFHFTDRGSGCSSGDESLSDQDRNTHWRKGRLDHKELLRKIPGAKSVTFLPLYDYAEERLVAGCFLWTSVNGRMMNLDEDLSHLHAFGNSIMSEAARINAQKNEAAKTTFIASMSHELRSPLHGILGATEFLQDTAADSYQAGLITSIITCGKTLLDTLNHVLDYSKINKLGRAQMRRNAKQNKLVNIASDSSLESINMTAEFDLAVLVEEVVEAVTAGHAFKKTDTVASSAGTSNASTPAADQQGTVSVLLNISPRESWRVKTQPGAVRRIIMNLLGNALKYTNQGFVSVSMKVQDSPSGNKLSALIQVADTGKGMSEEFQSQRLFVPFSQEDSFQPGTGLGLSIVKQIADSLGASIDVRSEQGVGTEIDVHMSLSAATRPAASAPEVNDIEAAEKLSKGLRLGLLDVELSSTGIRPPARESSAQRLEGTLAHTCQEWFGMKVIKPTLDSASARADVLLYIRPPSDEHLVQHYTTTAPGRRPVPIILACLDSEEAVRVSHHQARTLASLGRIVEVLPQPCGPRKLAKVLERCLRAVEDRVAATSPSAEMVISPSGREDQDTPKARYTAVMPSMHERPKIDTRIDSASSVTSKDSSSTKPTSVDASPAISPSPQFSGLYSPPPLDPNTPPLAADNLSRRSARSSQNPYGNANPEDSPIHILLVDDNKINLQLLVMFMKKNNYSYSTAENGLDALNAYKESCLPGPHTSSNSQPMRRFDYVLMDISMPVMNGMDSTKAIREFERENGMGRCTVIALTGLASAQAQREAEVVGIDVFLPKPVRFGELKKLLVANGIFRPHRSLMAGTRPSRQPGTAMLDDPSAPPIYRVSGMPPYPTPYGPLPAEIFPRQVTLRDRITIATLIPFSSPAQVPPRLTTYLSELLNREIEKGDTYPMMEGMAVSRFGEYWFSNFGAVMVLGDVQSADEVIAMENRGADWSKECLGSFYIKPNYPGRSSHVCSGDFLVTDAARNRGVGRLMGEGYLEWAPKLGYTYSVFNLVYETNVASLRIWDALGFKRIGRVKGCGNLKSYPDQLVDAIIFGRELGGEGDEYVSEERFDKIRFYLKTGTYPNGSDRAEKSRLRSAATHYRLIPNASGDGEEDKLMLKGKEVISDPHKQYEIARNIHAASHGGINKTTASIAEKYHWVRIKETVSAAIRNCTECKDSQPKSTQSYVTTSTKRSKDSSTPAGPSRTTRHAVVAGADMARATMSPPMKTQHLQNQPMTEGPAHHETLSQVLAGAQDQQQTGSAQQQAPMAPMSYQNTDYGDLPLDPQIMAWQQQQQHGHFSHSNSSRQLPHNPYSMEGASSSMNVDGTPVSHLRTQHGGGSIVMEHRDGMVDDVDEDADAKFQRELEQQIQRSDGLGGFDGRPPDVMGGQSG
ncbi:Virulence sensor protein BvgS [Teratosphaeria destructans]|uniref:Virulence sensor protein BvgS n=1 Tax=Teratosphaeria destructans TaxID=418781 RepID=A0A9W7SWN0_9PEZI|nr:Virulence sensor protein BvgS [Teratosphaeria destructans]